MMDSSWILLILSLSIACAFQICRSPLKEADLYIPTPEEQDCYLPPEEEHVKAHVRIYRPALVSWSVDAWSCMGINTTYYNTNSILGDGQSTHHAFGISEEECRQWKEQFQARGKRLHEKDHNLWVHSEDPRRPFEWFGSFYNVTTFILAKGTITTFNGETLFSNLADMSKCNLTDVKCYLKDRTIVLAQKIPYGRKRCVHEMENDVFEVLLSHEFVIVEKLQIALSYTGNNGYAERCFGRGALQMDNGIIIKFVQKEKKLRFKRDLSQNPSDFFEDDFNTEDVSTRNQTDFNPTALLINARANLAFIHFKRFLLAELDAVWLETCRLHNEFVDIVKAFVRLDATIGARLWLGRHDIAATLAGDVLMISSCRQVAVQRVFVGHKVNGTCFLYKPVLLEKSKQIWFVVPGTQDLVPSSPIEDCYERIEPVTEVHGEFQTLDGTTVEVSQFPWLSKDEVFYADVRDTHIDLTTRGVFNSELFENSVTNLADQDIRLRKLENQIRQWVEEQGTNNSLDIEVVKEEDVPLESLHKEDEFLEGEVYPRFKKYGVVAVLVVLLLTLLVMILVGIVIMWKSVKNEGKKNLISVCEKMKDPDCYFMLDEEGMAETVATVTNKRCNPQGVNAEASPESSTEPTGTVEILINDLLVHVTMDRTSNVSICNPDFADRLGAQELRSRMAPGVASDGSLVFFDGEVLVEMQMRGLKKPVRLATTYQMPDTDTVIIGTDILDIFGLGEPVYVSYSNRAFNYAATFVTQTVPLGLQVAGNRIGETYRIVRNAMPAWMLH